MPQLFQVLKCFNCSVFQVHQTKKSTKWECKLCGEKQSMKRHYGLGTGKECRLHVQKLNGIRGELDELNESAELNENSDEEVLVKTANDIPNKPASTNSKWSEFVDTTEDLKEPECKGSMYLGNTEVVLELPAKKRKFSKPKSKNQTATMHATSSETDVDLFHVTEPSSSDRTHFSMPSAIELPKKTLENRVIQSADQTTKCNINEPLQLKNKKPFVPRKIDKKSKWAQFADDTDEENSDIADLKEESENNSDGDFNPETTKNYTNNDGADIVENLHEFENEKHENSNQTHNLFSLCDENDLDDVLDI